MLVINKKHLVSLVVITVSWPVVGRPRGRRRTRAARGAWRPGTPPSASALSPTAAVGPPWPRDALWGARGHLRPHFEVASVLPRNFWLHSPAALAMSSRDDKGVVGVERERGKAATDAAAAAVHARARQRLETARLSHEAEQLEAEAQRLALERCRLREEQLALEREAAGSRARGQAAAAAAAVAATGESAARLENQALALLGGAAARGGARCARCSAVRCCCGCC